MSGHHSEHVGLQKHSVGDFYPYNIIGVGDHWCVARMTDMHVASWINEHGVPQARSWVYASDALDFLYTYAGGLNPVGMTYPLVWHPLTHSRSVDGPLQEAKNFVVENGLIDAPTSAGYKPTHGGYPS